MQLPGPFTRTITDTFGADGTAFLQRLPALLDACTRRWGLILGPPCPHLSLNYVVPARTTGGAEVVLKLGVPRPLFTEIEALRLYDGRGCVQLLDADPERGALLLERLAPGTRLATLPDDAEATAIAAGVMAQLWRPVPVRHSFPTVAGWAQGLRRLRRRFDGGTGPLPPGLVATAEALFAELIPSQAEPVLLHGDLHHDNILASERQPWLAIDPKGLVGEAAYETGALLRNPFPHLLDWPDLPRVQSRRVDQLAELLGFERERIVGWGIAQAVLAAWWSLEDSGNGWQPWIAIAGTLLGGQGDRVTG